MRKFNVYHMLACTPLWIILEPHHAKTLAMPQHLDI